MYASTTLPTLHLPLLSKDLNTTLCLDFIPYPQIDVTIRNFIRSLPAHKSAAIEFTAIASHIRFLSNNFVLAALPFLPRQYLKSDIRPFQRACTPLLVSLARVTEVLSCLSLHITVKTIEQLSNEYARMLLAREKSLLDDALLRDDSIRQWSVSGWREHRLMLAWEEALFSSGLLVRWKIVFCK
jgi:hypothetical protein